MNKIGLKNIEKDIQNIAEAISAALKVDVTIVDERLERIAGTGKYAEKIGQSIDPLSAFSLALKEEKPFIIENPRENAVCKCCSASLTCKEFAEVCCPIALDGKVAGVIGLVALDAVQERSIKENKSELMVFLNKMGELISGKLKAEYKSSELDREKRKLEALFDTMEKAVVATDDVGAIEKYNRQFADLFGIGRDIRGCGIGRFLSFLGEKLEEKSSTFYYEKGNVRGIYTIKPIIYNSRPIGYLLEFIDSKAAIKNYNDMTETAVHVSCDDILGKSKAIEAVKGKVRQASGSPSTLLITGESGTGKELFARAIHDSGERRDFPFIAVNCGAIPDSLLESELFGYEEGAFTGAKKGGKLGKLEIANKGTLFLDEIGDMSLHLQVKLLRVLQEREIERVGSNKKIKIDVRIICATHKNLEEMVAKGEFRKDLYFRLNVIPITIPPLRERKEDIPILIESIIKRCNAIIKKDIKGVDGETLAYIMRYPWPGNIRELQNTIEYAVNMTVSDYIGMSDLPERLRGNMQADARLAGPECESVVPAGKDGEITALKELEKLEIIKALKQYERYKNDKEMVCRALGISRATLYRKMKEFDLVSN